MQYDKQALAELAKADFKVFIALHDSSFVFTPFHLHLIQRIQEIAEGKLTRYCLSCPPRHGKSRLLSELAPAWFFARNISEQIMGISYSASLAAEFGRKVRGLMQSETYLSLFPESAILGDGVSGAGWVMNEPTQKGMFKAVGIGGSLTGFGASLMCVDDVTKSKADSVSPVVTKAMQEFLGATAFTRLSTDGRIIIVNTRWSHNDAIGYVMREFGPANGWLYENIPAIAEEEDLLGRAPGEALWPERFPVHRLAEIKTTLGLADFSALYQGDPQLSQMANTPWQSKYWKLTKQPLAKGDLLLVSIDAANELYDGSDYTGITIWLRGMKKVHALKASKLKLDFTALLDYVLKLNTELSYKIRKPLFLVEKAANGIALGQHLSNVYSHIDVEFCSAHTKKKELFELACNTMELFDVEFADEAIQVPEELSQWPLLEHDDIAISAMQALEKLGRTPVQAMAEPAFINIRKPSRESWN